MTHIIVVQGTKREVREALHEWLSLGAVRQLYARRGGRTRMAYTEQAEVVLLPDRRTAVVVLS